MTQKSPDIHQPSSQPEQSTKVTETFLEFQQQVPFSRLDCLIAFGLGLLAASIVIGIVMWKGEALALRSLGGRWFQSDGWRVFDNKVDFLSNQHRNQVRPLFSLIALPITVVIQHSAQLTDIQAIWGLNSLCFAMWAGLIFLTVRLLGVSRLGALLTSLLGMVSGAALFWFTVPETYPLSSLAIVFCLFLAAYETNRRRSRSKGSGLIADLALVLAGAFSLGTLLTNWMISLALNFSYRPWLKAIGLSLASLVLTTAGWGLQKIVFPQPAAFFLKVSPESEMEYVLHEEQGNVFNALHTALISSVVVPAVQEYNHGIQPTGKRLTIQQSHLFNSGWGYAILAMAWIACLALGGLTLMRTPHLQRFAVVILAALAGQLALHSVYGEETFLYALHFTPLLILSSVSFLSWSSLFSRRSIFFSILITILIALIATNNMSRLYTSVSTIDLPEQDERLFRLKPVQE